MTQIFPHRNTSLRRWLRNFSLFITLVLFIGFCSVIPIDSISQASRSSSNYALNTFVTVGALVVFGITSLVISFSRVYGLRSAMSDIPKRYVPLDNGDMSKSCLMMINENFQKCEKIKKLSLMSIRNVNHPGLSNPQEMELPPLLPFENVVKAIGMKLKWDNRLNGTNIELPRNQSFREIVAFLETMLVSTNKSLNREYVELYEEFRYSKKLISREKFLRFMELSLLFVKQTRLKVGNEKIPNTSKNHSTESIIDRDSNFSRDDRSKRLRSDSYFSNYDWTRYEDKDKDDNGLKRANTVASVETTGTTRYN